MAEKTHADRRIVRTRDAILNAFLSLIEEKGFDSISISDITGRADINRGTFYLHYRDKYDLLEKIEDEIINNMKDILLESSQMCLDAYYTDVGPVPVMIQLFTYIKGKANVMHALIGLREFPGFQSRIKKAILSNLFDLGFFSHKSETDLLVPGEYLVSYLSAAHMGVVQAWLTNGCKETPEEMAHILARLSFQGPFRAIRMKSP